MLLTTTAVGIRRVALPLRLTALLIICSLVVGCGKAGPPQGRVVGKVTLDGEPLGAGQVHLYSKKQGTGGRATLDANGNFKVTTPLLVGEYTALVTPPLPTVAPGVAPQTTPDDASNPPPTVNIPQQYLSEATSDLKVTVEADQEVAVVLELHGDGRPAPVTPVEPATDVATTTPEEKAPGEKAPAESQDPSLTSVEKTNVAAKPAEPVSQTGDAASASVAVAPDGVSGQTWILAAGGGGFVLAAIAVGAFIFLRGRSAPVRPVHMPFAPHPVSGPVAHGASAAFPRLAKAPGAEKPSPPSTTDPAASPTPEADQAPAIPQVVPPVAAPAAVSAPVTLAVTAPETAATAPGAAPVTPPATEANAAAVTPPVAASSADTNPAAGASIPVPAPPAVAQAVDSTKNASPPETLVAPAPAQPPPSASDPLEERAAERDIAEWVLARGGRLRVRTNEGESANLSQVSEIPAKPFRVSAVLFNKHNALSHDDLERLAGLADLHMLDLTSTNVTDESLRHLTRLPHLRELALSRTKITDNGLAHLREMHELRVLLLYRTSVTDAGLAHLRGCNSLRLVELKHTQVTDAGVKLLVALPRLEELIVDDTRVTREGLARIQAAFPRVKFSHVAKATAAESSAVGTV